MVQDRLGRLIIDSARPKREICDMFRRPRKSADSAPIALSGTGIEEATIESR
jgi:hypothetical protein